MTAVLLQDFFFCRSNDEACISLSCARGLIQEALPWISWPIFQASQETISRKQYEAVSKLQDKMAGLLATAVSATSAVAAFLTSALLKVFQFLHKIGMEGDLLRHVSINLTGVVASVASSEIELQSEVSEESQSFADGSRDDATDVVSIAKFELSRLHFAEGWTRSSPVWSQL